MNNLHKKKWRGVYTKVIILVVIFLIVLTNAMASDFRVNRLRGYYSYADPYVALGNSGNYVMVWEQVYGYKHSIYCQRFDRNGAPIGTQFQVDDESITFSSKRPQIALDTNENFLIVWKQSSVFARHYDSHGIASGSKFAVSTASGSGDFAFDMNSRGDFVVAVIDKGHISTRYYDSKSGTFELGEVNPIRSLSYPAIGIKENGNYVVVWHEPGTAYNWKSAIVAKYFDHSGRPLRYRFKVNDIDIRNSGRPTLDIDINGNIVIAWEDYRDGSFDIYAQRFDSSAVAIDSNFRVNSNPSRNSSPAMDFDGNGNFVIAWQDERDRHIYTQRYLSTGVASGTNYQVTREMSDIGAYGVSLSRNAIGDFVLGWQRQLKGARVTYSQYNWGIYSQYFDASGTPRGNIFKVTTDDESRMCRHPVISAHAGRNFVIAWQDGRDGNYDIYAQRYQANGKAVGDNFLVNDDVNSSHQIAPSIGKDIAGNFVISWQDTRNGHPDIYGQRYNFKGTKLGANFRINDDEENNNQKNSAICVQASGKYLVVWADERNSNSDIYAQLFNPSGSAQGDNFQINDDVGSSNQQNPSIVVDYKGNYIITWEDERNENYDIYAQRYNSNGITFGTNFKVNDVEDVSNQSNPSIDVNFTGDFTIVWQDERNGDSDIYAQQFYSNGTELGVNFRVNDDQGGNQQYYPSITMDKNGTSFIVWQDDRNGDADIYGQQLIQNGFKSGSNFIINSDGEGIDQTLPATFLSKGKLYTTWEDNLVVGLETNILATVLSLDSLTKSGKFDSHILHQNYPNPFNSGTKIHFNLPLSGHLSLRIYNMRGQLIHTLIDEWKMAGYQTVDWTGRDENGQLVGSGLYFCKLKIEKVEETRSIILIK